MIIRNFLIVLVSIFIVSSAFAAPGDLLWEDHFDREVGNNADFANDVVIGRGRVFVVGGAETSAGGTDFAVRAYAKKTGELLWSDYYDPAGNTGDEAVAADVFRNKLVVVGDTTSSVSRQMTVRAYNTKTGALIWSNDFSRSDGYGFNLANDVVISNGKVFVVGVTEATIGGTAFTIRAYRLRNGELLWEDHFNRIGNEQDGAKQVIASGNKVFVAGYSFLDSNTSAFTVRAYSAKTGALIWDDYYHRQDSYDTAYFLTVLGKRLYVAGSTNTNESYNALTLRSYSQGSGRLFWTQHVNRDENGGEEIGGIVAQDGRVFVASQSGMSLSGAGYDAFAVRAFKARNGELLWQDIHNAEGELVDGAADIAIKGKKLYVVGSTETTAGDSAMATRVYRAKTGSLVWQDNYDRVADGEDEAKAVAVSGSNVFVAGSTKVSGGSDSAFSVRAYKDR